MTRLLVIEDHALVREGLVQTLKLLGAGVEVSDVADFDGANTLLEKESVFDLVLLDLGLPGVDGITCLKSFRQRYPDMPVVILSAYDDVQTIGKAMACGASGFVSKAYSSERLLAVLRDVLAGKVMVPELSPVIPFSSEPHPPMLGGESDPFCILFGKYTGKRVRSV
jgi:DNA-binding NarL/FixJ family response regulator